MTQIYSLTFLIAPIKLSCFSTVVYFGHLIFLKRNMPKVLSEINTWKKNQICSVCHAIPRTPRRSANPKRPETRSNVSICRGIFPEPIWVRSLSRSPFASRLSSVRIFIHLPATLFTPEIRVKTGEQMAPVRSYDMHELPRNIFVRFTCSGAVHRLKPDRAEKRESFRGDKGGGGTHKSGFHLRGRRRPPLFLLPETCYLFI